METEIWVNIGLGNGLLSDNTKPLPEPMLIDHQWSPVIFILGQFHKRWLIHQSLKSVWKVTICLLTFAILSALMDHFECHLINENKFEIIDTNTNFVKMRSSFNSLRLGQNGRYFADDYLNQCWSDTWMHICGTGGDELTHWGRVMHIQ